MWLSTPSHSSAWSRRVCCTPVTVNSSARASSGAAKRSLGVAGILAASLLVLGACGSSSSSSSSSPAPASTPSTAASTAPATSSTPAAAAAPATSPAHALHLEANREGQLKYNTTSLSAKAGEVSIDFTNMSPLGHNLTVESASGSVIGATPTFQGATKTLSLQLKAGTYKFFCTVPGHRMAGMEGTLTVK